MLDTTRAATFVPGSNRREAASGAAWLALLPTMEPGRVLVLGVPAEQVLIALARASGRLTVRCATRREGRRARAILAERPAKVEVGEASLPDASFDLIVIARGQAANAGEPARALAPGGTIVAEESGATRVDLPAAERITLTPSVGEIAAAAPEGSDRARRALEQRGLWNGGVVARAFGRSREVRGPWTRALPERRLVVAAPGPPAYLRRVAAEAGVDVARHDWAMAAPGRYRSNKILFFLFEPGSGSPAFVVKATRDPELNGRLENERDALDHLRGVEAVHPSSIPAVAFWGVEAGRALLGTIAIEGRAFSDVTQADAGCPYAARAFDRLLRLGTATAAPSNTAGRELGGHLRELFGTFLSLYELGPDHRRFLEDQIDLVEQAREAFPVVFQHGDPGTWNLLARDDGTVAFLDWEAAERRGVPLWDVFHLARSFAVVSGRAKGERSMMRSIEQHLLSPTPINGLIADVVARYREQVGVPGDLVEPLFHLSWMHRALKEAMRLSEDRLRSSHYLALLRRGIELRSGAGLRRLLAGDGASA